MCKWGNDKLALVPSRPCIDGAEGFVWRFTKIDSCIASLVQRLNEEGVYTLASCCGHGKRHYADVSIWYSSVGKAVVKGYKVLYKRKGCEMFGPHIHFPRMLPENCVEQ